MSDKKSTPNYSKPMERRAIAPGACELRAESDGKLRGYAVVFDQWADDGWGGTEMVRQGAFKKTLKESPDIRALWNHDTSKVLGRTTAGTLSLKEDKHGLAIEIDPPDTQAGKDAVISIERGDVSQMSFGFNVIKDEAKSDESGNWKRELIELRLHEVSPVTFPFYPTTEIGLRTALIDAGVEGEALEKAVDKLSKNKDTFDGISPDAFARALNSPESRKAIIDIITAASSRPSKIRNAIKRKRDEIEKEFDLPSDTAILEDITSSTKCTREGILAALSDECSVRIIAGSIKHAQLRAETPENIQTLNKKMERALGDLGDIGFRNIDITFDDGFVARDLFVISDEEVEVPRSHIGKEISDIILYDRRKNSEPGESVHSENTTEPDELHSDSNTQNATSEPDPDSAVHSTQDSTGLSGDQAEPGQERNAVDAGHSPDEPDESTVTDPSTENVDDAETSTETPVKHFSSVSDIKSHRLKGAMKRFMHESETLLNKEQEHEDR